MCRVTCEWLFDLQNITATTLYTVRVSCFDVSCIVRGRNANWEEGFSDLKQTKNRVRKFFNGCVGELVSTYSSRRARKSGSPETGGLTLGVTPRNYLLSRLVKASYPVWLIPVSPPNPNRTILSKRSRLFACNRGESVALGRRRPWANRLFSKSMKRKILNFLHEVEKMISVISV